MLNNIILNGFVTRDSELKTAGTKGDILIFTIAHNQRFKTPDGKVNQKSFFIEINLFGALAKSLHPHIKKGKEIDVVGKLDISYWEYNGEKMSKPFIKASEIILRSNRE